MDYQSLNNAQHFLNLMGQIPFTKNSFNATNQFVGPIYDGRFQLPWINDEFKRDVILVIQNFENNLDLQIKANCKKTSVSGYVLTSDITSVD